MTLLAVDPSINCSGIALFEGGVMTGAKPVHKLPYTGHVTRRAAAMVVEIARSATMARESYGTPFAHAPMITDLVLEWPQIYTHGTNDRNDLLGLAAVCGGLATAAFEDGVTTTCYLPHEWTQNLKKAKSGDPKESPRGLYIGRRLEGRELDIWAKVSSHDVVDAIGIGLHHLGRMERKRVFPGAT